MCLCMTIKNEEEEECDGRRSKSTEINSQFIAAILVGSGCGRTRLTASSLYLYILPVCACLHMCVCVYMCFCLTLGMDNWFDSPLSPSG